MLETDTRLRPQTADVAAKVIDGEAIIMNLSNGLYFSMDNVGAAVWELLEEGRSVGEMTTLVASHYRVDPAVVGADVRRLLQELLDEGLVEVGEGVTGTGEGPVLSAPGMGYSAPTLNKYSDMADLLALDPPMPSLGDPPLPS